MITVGSSLVAILIFLIAQLMAAIWWASSIQTKMNFMIDASKEFARTKDTYSTREEIARALALSDKNITAALAIADRQLKAMWDRIDELKK